MIERVTEAAAAMDEARNALYWAVQDARGEGASWADIGDALGITRQAAQQRFSPAAVDSQIA